MINQNTIKQSLVDTLKADVTLRDLLKTGKGDGSIFVGSGYPLKTPLRFILVSTFGTQQDIDEVKMEYTSVAVTIAVKESKNSAGDDVEVANIAARVNTLVDETPTAFTLPDDLIANVSRESSLAPELETVGTVSYLISQERYELMTTAKV